MKKHRAFSLFELSVVLLVTGLIIAGVLKGVKLINAARLSVAQTMTKKSGVDAMDGLVLWLETSLNTSFASTELGDSLPISTWYDNNPQTLNKINLTQSTSSNKPTLKIEGIGKIPSLLFDGTNDYLSSSSSPIPEGTSQYTIFLVWKTTTVSGPQVIFTQVGTACNGDFAGVYLSGAGKVNTWGCGASKDLVSSNYTANNPYIFVYRVDNSQSTNISTFLNGSAGPTSTKTLSIKANGVSAGYGNDGGGNIYYFNGYISEVIVFSRALKTSERQSVEAYLGKKFNITIAQY